MVVDASIWVSALIIRDIHHLESRQWLDGYLATEAALVAPTLLLPEVAGAVARRTGTANLGRQAVAQILQAPGLRLVPLGSDLAMEAAWAAADLQLRGADAVYVAVAYTLNLPLITWDQELQASAGGYIQVLHP